MHLFIPAKIKQEHSKLQSEAYFPTDYTKWFSGGASPRKLVFPQRLGAVSQDPSHSCCHLHLTCSAQLDQHYFEALEGEMTQKCVVFFFQQDETVKNNNVNWLSELCPLPFPNDKDEKQILKIILFSLLWHLNVLSYRFTDEGAFWPVTAWKVENQ